MPCYFLSTRCLHSYDCLGCLASYSVASCGGTSTCLRPRPPRQERLLQGYDAQQRRPNPPDLSGRAGEGMGGPGDRDSFEPRSHSNNIFRTWTFRQVSCPATEWRFFCAFFLQALSFVLLLAFRCTWVLRTHCSKLPLHCALPWQKNMSADSTGHSLSLSLASSAPKRSLSRAQMVSLKNHQTTHGWSSFFWAW